MASILENTNLSFFTIPAAWACAIIPHFYAAALYESSSTNKFDNTQPRALIGKLEADQTLSQATKDKIKRAEGAQQNGFENVALFAAAVTAGNVGGVDTFWLNALSLGYLSSRVLYNLIYINNSTPGLAAMRSTVFISGVGMIMTLFVKAGNALNAARKL
jgi:uncharacterized MAPEG superfamily protein